MPRPRTQSSIDDLVRIRKEEIGIIRRLTLQIYKMSARSSWFATVEGFLTSRVRKSI
jgi:hypothetical protein